MFVHVFGTYFGLAISFVLGRKEKPKEHDLEGSSYQSDISAMIGMCQTICVSIIRRLDVLLNRIFILFLHNFLSVKMR